MQSSPTGFYAQEPETGPTAAQEAVSKVLAKRGFQYRPQDPMIDEILDAVATAWSVQR